MYHFTALYSFLEIPSSIISQNNSNIQSEIVFGSYRSEDEIHGKEIDITHGLSTSPQESNQIPSINDVELSRNKSANVSNDVQSLESMKDQWRKVFLNLRRSLKPHDVAVYLFIIYHL